MKSGSMPLTFLFLNVTETNECSTMNLIKYPINIKTVIRYLYLSLLFSSQLFVSMVVDKDIARDLICVLVLMVSCLLWAVERMLLLLYQEPFLMVSLKGKGASRHSTKLIL